MSIKRIYSASEADEVGNKKLFRLENRFASTTRKNVAHCSKDEALIIALRHMPSMLVARS